MQGHNAHAEVGNIDLRPPLPRQIVCLREHDGDFRRKMVSFVAMARTLSSFTRYMIIAMDTLLNKLCESAFADM